MGHAIRAVTLRARHLLPLPWLLTGALASSCLAALPPDSQLETQANPTPGFQRWVFAFGDWGTGGTGQREVAAQLARSADQYLPAFVLLLGDNFYEQGVTGVSDPAWNSRFEDVYAGGTLQIPFYSVLGNHDHITSGSAAAEIAYTAEGRRWRMPAAYYTFVDTIVVPVLGLLTVRYVGLDTEALVRNLAAATQLAWLDSVLTADSSRWVVVYGHHPLYGTGPYGDTPGLHPTLRPLLEQHAVNIYLAAHAHSLQVSRPINGVTYIVSGGGAAFDRAHAIGASPNIIFAIPDGGFVALGFGSGGCAIQMINRDGYKLFETEVASP